MQIPQQNLHPRKSQIQSIKEASYQIKQIQTDKNQYISSTGISNSLKYIIAVGNKFFKIWKYNTNYLIKHIKLDDHAMSCKFTEDSQLLYVGTYKTLHQFSVNNFKKLSRQNIHDNSIINIYCITNIIILTSSQDNTIIKTNVSLKQQLMKIQIYKRYIWALDYNKRLNIIASGLNYNTIKLWDGIDGFLILEKQNSKQSIQRIYQLLFIIDNNQLISLDLDKNLIIWNINYNEKQIEKLQLISNSGFNISMVLEQQFVISIGNKFIKVFTIKGTFIRQFEHDIDEFASFFTIQHDSMKAVLIKGSYKLQVCKINLIA